MVSFTSFTVTGEKPLVPVNHTHPSIHLIFPFIAWYRLIKTINRPFLIRFPPHKFKWLLASREISSSCKSSQSKHGRSTDIRTNEIEGRFLEGVFFLFQKQEGGNEPELCEKSHRNVNVMGFQCVLPLSLHSQACGWNWFKLFVLIRSCSMKHTRFM